LPSADHTCCGLPTANHGPLLEDGRLLMGEDLGGTGELLAVGRNVSTEQRMQDESSSDPEHEVHFVFDVRRRGGDQLEELELVLTLEHARVLLHGLSPTLRGWRGSRADQHGDAASPSCQRINSPPRPATI
jgi:hypothetical protein